MAIVQCSTHSSIRHYSAVISWLGIIHIPIDLTLIIAVNGLSQLDVGCLRKRGFELIGLVSSNWNHPTVIVHCLALLVYIASTSCAHCCLLHIPILIHHRQLIGVTMQPTHIFPNLNEAQTIEPSRMTFTVKVTWCNVSCHICLLLEVHIRTCRPPSTR